MKRTLSFMVMALALLLTQCRKPEVKFPTPSSAEGVTVSMTVTAGPGSKTDITTAGGITWSTDDKLYVGDGAKYIGCLTLQGAGGSATGTFSGDVTLTGITEDTPHTFGFFYLGSGNGVELTYGAGSVVVSFATQEIYANGTNLSDDAKKFHVGYGSASGTVKDGRVTGINVTLVSKVALAHFSFKKGGNGYSNALTLSGDHIYNSMTVGFDGTFVGTSGSTTSGISLTGSHSERYVMLVPVGTGSETLSFAGDGFEGSTTLGSGIEPNKFYGRDGAIEVKPTPKFTVGKDGSGNPITVEFSPGNLYWDGTESKFKFESNQWSTTPASSNTWDANHVSHFKWSDAANAVTGNNSYSGDLFCASNFTVAGDSHTDWHTLTDDEWSYLLGESSPGRAKSLRHWSEVKFGYDGPCVHGLIIMPDGWEGTLAPTTNYITWQGYEEDGAVFLPAAGNRSGTYVYNVDASGIYWTSTPDGSSEAWYMSFAKTGDPIQQTNDKYKGYSVRLVR